MRAAALLALAAVVLGLRPAPAPQEGAPALPDGGVGVVRAEERATASGDETLTVGVLGEDGRVRSLVFSTGHFGAAHRDDDVPADATRAELMLRLAEAVEAAEPELLRADKATGVVRIEAVEPARGVVRVGLSCRARTVYALDVDFPVPSERPLEAEVVFSGAVTGRTEAGHPAVAVAGTTAHRAEQRTEDHPDLRSLVRALERELEELGAEVERVAPTVLRLRLVGELAYRLRFGCTDAGVDVHGEVRVPEVE